MEGGGRSGRNRIFEYINIIIFRRSLNSVSGFDLFNPFLGKSDSESLWMMRELPSKCYEKLFVEPRCFAFIDG